MEESNVKGFYQSAMQYGTYLGIFWAIMYIMLFESFSSPMISMVAMAMFIASPFFAGNLAIRYRKTECGNYIKYPQAWTFLFCMYVCATLLSAMTNYIYLDFIDKGSFIMEMHNILSDVTIDPNTDPSMLKQIEAMAEVLSQLTPIKITWSFLSNNIFCSLLLPPIIAFFVRKNTEI